MRVQKNKNKVDRNILAVTDFSKSSTNAILFAAHLFKDANLKFKLLNVFENPSERATLLISVEDILTKDSEVGLKKQSAELASELKKLKPTISTHSLTGRLKKAISTIAQSEDVDLIVSGIPGDKDPCKNLNHIPLLFMGQSKLPVLIVPEKCLPAPIKNILVLNLDPHSHKRNPDKEFEYIINHDHISKHILSLNERKKDATIRDTLQTALKNQKTDLIIIIPAIGDKIDRLLLDYQIKELCPTIAALLNC